MSQIILPELIYQPARYTVGYVEQLLSAERTVEVSEIEKVKVGARATADCLVLTTGERVIVTKRAAIAVPSDVDGVLRERPNGTRVWLTHRLLVEARKAVGEKGSGAYISSQATAWRKAFRFKPDPESGGEGLRPPQLGALFAIGSHWSIHSEPATVVMPTGTGKTETMLSVLASQPLTRMVVAVPSKALRRQTARKFLSFGLLRSLGLLSGDAPNPMVGVLTKQPKSEDDLAIFSECNVIVAVIASLAGGEAKALARRIAARCDVLVVDEAHHIAARTWSDFREAFSEKKVLQFTATPFRGDGKLVDGRVIFSYSLRKAQADGYFKPLQFVPVRELRAQVADDAIAQEACKRLRADLGAGHDHLMMARCDSIERAGEVLTLYVKHGKEFFPQLIHSDLSDADQRVARLLDGTSRIAVCVNMLGEGFDLPSLKIAALHDPQKSLGPLLQFTGRFTRSAGKNLGNASIVANIADPNVSLALERLYSEDSDWNVLLSEMSSHAAKDHAELVEFLNASVSLGEVSVEGVNISHHLLRPTLSTWTYTCSSFSPKRFHEAVPSGTEVVRVWLNENTRTLYFVVRTLGRVKWTRSKELEDVEWNLFVIHHDTTKGLLYLASSDKSSNHEGLAKAVGAQAQISGEQIFRSLGQIGRLVFNNLGVTKHGRRNLSYAMYTGVDVRQALSLSEKSGSRKANLSGQGWEGGKQVTIGCSYKGRVWSKEAGTLPRFIEWAERVGGKLLDTRINTADIIDNVLIPDEVSSLPPGEVLGIEWPLEILRQPEERVDLRVDANDNPIYLCDIQLKSVDRSTNAVHFSVMDVNGDVLGDYALEIGGTTGFLVRRLSASPITLSMGALDVPLEKFLSDYPPLVRFIDLAELDGNLVLRPQSPYELKLPAKSLVPWDWAKTDIKKESIWKDGAVRKESVQWAAATRFIADGFDIVFDDDGPGEAADLICVKEESNSIRLVLVHCKFSGGGKAGARIDDLVVVSSQAIRSARWAGKFKELCRHMLKRIEKRDGNGRTFMLRGDLADIGRLSKVARFKEVKPEVFIVQPGVSAAGISAEQSMVLAAAASYLKETIGVDVSIACSE